MMLLTPAAGAEFPSREYAIKAAFLYKFADYVDWPSSTFDAPDSALTICIIGSDPFGPGFDSLVEGEKSAGHRIAIKRLPASGGSAHCQVAYVVAPNGDSLVQDLAPFAGRPVLTVTDGAAEAGPHGIMNFVLSENRVRFEVDEKMAADHGLTVSSKLLSLAISVRSRDDARKGAL